MSAEPAKIVIEPYKKIIIHEVIENRFPDLVNAVLNEARVAGGTTIPQLSWCKGVVFQIYPFSADSEAVIKAQLEGIIHYSNVTFAVKEKYEKEVRIPEGTVFLVDESANPNFVELAGKLKERAQFKN
jgi:cell division ATPase FtsA